MRPQTIILVFACAVTMFHRGRAQPIQTLRLNSSSSGTTKAAQRNIFTNFAKLDIGEPRAGLGGQVLYELSIPGTFVSVNLEVSTCQGSDFDTYLVLLDDNPQLNENVTVMSESANDIICDLGSTKASLTTQVESGSYFLLVTGNGEAEGTFNVTAIGVLATPTPIPWGLDRIDQRGLPLDGRFAVQDSGQEVFVYLIDSGVRVTHEEFEGRAIHGYDFVNNREGDAADCTGHGTHAAGIIAGKTFGISKKTKIIAVRAFDCNNKGRTSAIVDSLGWILADSRNHIRTNVLISMMFSSTPLQSSILQSAINGIQRSGIPVVVPAGNNAGNACRFYPGSLSTFLTVGSTDENDRRSQFSNFGNCTNVYAPGSAIMSSWYTSDTSWRVMSGTAQAAAHMTGIVSNLLTLNKGIEAELVINIIESISTLDVVQNVAANDSTRFAFVRSVPAFTETPPPERSVYIFTVLKMQIPTCNASSNEIRTIQKTFAGVVDVKISQLLLTCELDRLSQQVSNSRVVQLRFEVSERRATADFVLLESSLSSSKSKIESELGFRYEVSEEPWAVDSTPIVFWGAPTFSETESSSLSRGAVAGILVGLLFLASLLVTVTWLFYRKVTRIDEIESLEGSADYEKGPVHFNDFENNDGSSMVMRSFRNVMRGLSFKRSGSMRSPSAIGGDKGMNRMGSFIGGAQERAGKDMVRLESFGGEAFAGMNSISRSYSNAPIDSKSGIRIPSLRGASFRGLNNLVLQRSGSVRGKGSAPNQEETESEMDESLRMQSLGGEAFAVIGQDIAPMKNEQQRSGGAGQVSVSMEDGAMRRESYGAEALAEDTSARGQSFFGAAEGGS